MKHFIGPSNYSTYHSYTQAQARPIQLPDLGSVMSAVGHVNRANDVAEAKIKAAQEKAEAEAAKQAANAESHSRVYGPITNQAVGNGYSSDRGGTYETPPVGYYRPFGDSNTQHADLSEQMQTNFFDRYVANQSQLNALYPAPSNIEMGAGRAIMSPGYQAPAMAPTTSPQSYFKPFGGYHEGYNQSGYPFGG